MSLVATLAALPLAATLAFGGVGAAVGGSTDALLVLGSSAPAVAKVGLDTATHAGRIVPMHTKKQCDREMNAGAKVCSRLRPAQAAAICHAANMVRYAGCLAGASG